MVIRHDVGLVKPESSALQDPSIGPDQRARGSPKNHRILQKNGDVVATCHGMTLFHGGNMGFWMFNLKRKNPQLELTRNP